MVAGERAKLAADIVDAKQLALIFDVKPRTIRFWAEQRRIPGLRARPASPWRFSVKAVMKSMSIGRQRRRRRRMHSEEG